MMDYNKSVAGALKAILPTQYELYDKKMNLPCITYIERNNNSLYLGETIEYARIMFTVKLWAYKKSDIENYANQIDNAMRPLGFKRVQTNELTMDNQICKIFTYQALSREDFETITN